MVASILPFGGSSSDKGADLSFWIQYQYGCCCYSTNHLWSCMFYHFPADWAVTDRHLLFSVTGIYWTLIHHSNTGEHEDGPREADSSQKEGGEVASFSNYPLSPKPITIAKQQLSCQGCGEGTGIWPLCTVWPTARIAFLNGNLNQFLFAILQISFLEDANTNILTPSAFLQLTRVPHFHTLLYYHFSWFHHSCMENNFTDNHFLSLWGQNCSHGPLEH